MSLERNRHTGPTRGPALRDAGYDVRILSRRTHGATAGIEFVKGDLAKDEGIDAAVAPHFRTSRSQRHDD